MNRLENKIIIVTGGSGLLGKAIINNIKKEGGIPINVDAKVEKKLDQGTWQCDITQENEIDELVKVVIDKFGRIDGLVNNAYPRTKDWGEAFFEDESASSWSTNVDIQMNSYVTCCRKVFIPMKKQKYGTIINMTSIYGVVGPNFSIYEGTNMTNPAAYAAIKGGLINFTRYLASYGGPFNIRANCISPGGIYDAQNQDFVERYEQKVPLKRMGKPEDIAPAACFLLSDEASYITGHNLLVDGGWTSV